MKKGDCFVVPIKSELLAMIVLLDVSAVLDMTGGALIKNPPVEPGG